MENPGTSAAARYYATYEEKALVQDAKTAHQQTTDATKRALKVRSRIYSVDRWT